MTHERIEREAKLPVGELAPVRRRLEGLKARLLGTVEQHDTLFDFPDGRLTDANAALRLRRTENGGAITYKGAPRPGGFKQRTEYETPVGNPEAAALLFAGLGLVPILSYQKRRETWAFKECEVCLDEVPLLGCFVEIEGPDVAVIENVARDLQLEPTSHVHASYPQLLSQECKVRKLDPTRLTQEQSFQSEAGGG